MSNYDYVSDKLKDAAKDNLEYLHAECEWQSTLMLAKIADALEKISNEGILVDGEVNTSVYRYGRNEVE